MIVIVFAAGFMRGIDHILLAQYFTSSLQFLVIPIVIWTIYVIYVLQFNSRLLKYPENTFVSSFILLPSTEQWFATLAVSTIQLLPNLLYGIFLILISFKNASYHSAGVVLLVLLSHLLGAAFILKKKLARPDFEQRIGVITRWISGHLVRPFPVICIEWSMRRQPFQTIGLKICGLALIHATLYLYETDTYDLRLAGIGVTFAFALNTAFVFAAHDFIVRGFPLFRQMPFSHPQRWLHIIIILALFTLPELIILTRNLPGSFHPLHAPLLYGFGLSANALMFNFLFVRNRTTEKTMPWMYIFIVLTFFAVLGGIHLGILTAINTAGSFLLMRRFYYRHEPVLPVSS
jgi:hypothetical protein